MEKINFQIEWFFKPEDDNDGIDAVATTATAAASSAAAFAADTAAAANNDDNKDNNDDRDDMDDKKDGGNDKNNGDNDETNGSDDENNKEDLRYDTNHLLLYFIKQILVDIHINFIVHLAYRPILPYTVCLCTVQLALAGYKLDGYLKYTRVDSVSGI